MGQGDYNSGMAGNSYSPGMDREDYEAGKSVYDAKQRILGAGEGPKTPISGPGFVGIVMAPFLAIMYPVAGITVATGLILTWFSTRFLDGNLTGVRILVFLAAAVGSLWLALKLEHKASESRLYRNLRHPFRLLVIAIIPMAYTLWEDSNTISNEASNSAAGGAIFFGLCGVLFMHWLFPKFDRVFFPVMDSKAIAEEKKYAGLNEDEVFAIKHRRFHGQLWFLGTWIAGTAGLMFLLPQVSAALIVAGCFAVCWLLRKTLFFREAK